MVQKLYGFKLTVTMVMISAYTIYSRNSTITTTKSSSYESKELDIYGNVVVWIESDNVYMYDIATHKITQVTDSGKQETFIYMTSSPDLKLSSASFFPFSRTGQLSYFV